MLDRRLFLSSMLSAGPLGMVSPGPWFTANQTKTNFNDCLIPPDQILRIRQRDPVTLQSHYGIYKNVPIAKQQLLVDTIRLLAGQYPGADHEAWIKGILRREDLGSSGIGGLGLIHQYQYRKKGPSRQTRHPQGDCWTLLSPEEVEFDALDGQRVQVLFAFMTPYCDSVTRLNLEYALIDRIYRVAKRLEELHIGFKEISRCDPRQVSQLLNRLDTRAIRPFQVQC